MKLPILYHKAKGGELRQWEVWTEGDTIYTRHGMVGGQLITSDGKVAMPKNIGKKNETTGEQQADMEAQSLWTHKVERKYSETPEKAQEQLPLPMLAHPYKGTKKKKFEWPGHAQPKLDGVRCLAQRGPDGEIVLTSRQGKVWDIPHISAQLENWLPADMILDGEIYVHGESCQRITSWAKSAREGKKSFKPESRNLVYHVYDVPMSDGDDTLPWEKRFQALFDLVDHSSENVHFVDTITVDNQDELDKWHGKFIGEGYEGAILRGLSGPYLWGFRSAELLKVKEFQDAEFEVVDAEEGVGKMAGCVVFICRNDLTDGTFKTTMKMPMAVRKQMWDERAQYMGRPLTVRFFDRTDDQIPRFPVGIVFRDAADLPA